MFTDIERAQILSVKESIRKRVKYSLSLFDGQPYAQEFAAYICDNFFVTGGISASIFSSTPVKDIDLYYNKTVVVDDYNKEIIRLFGDGGSFSHFVKEIDPKYMESEVQGKVITANAVTLKNDMQIIRLAGVNECREIFDFKHCLPVYDIKNDVYKISRNEFDSLTTRKLMTHHGTPKQFRIDKFIQRGWGF